MNYPIYGQPMVQPMVQPMYDQQPNMEQPLMNDDTKIILSVVLLGCLLFGYLYYTGAFNNNEEDTEPVTSKPRTTTRPTTRTNTRPTSEAPNVLSSVIPPEDKTTNYDLENLVALDRHNVDCGSRGINRIHYQRDGDGNMRYEYTCNGPSKSDKKPKSTNFNWEALIGLDRHNIECDSGDVLNQFHYKIEMEVEI